MKRLLAFAALILGLAALTAPVQARIFAHAKQSEISRVERPCESTQMVRRQSDKAGPVMGGSCRGSDTGKSSSRGSRTVILPTIMLVDRPLE